MKRQKSLAALWCTSQSGLAFVAFAWAAVAASKARAATVTFALVPDPTSANNGCVGCTLNGPGTWDLYASASHGDNFGIARYQVTLLNTTSIFNRSPQTALSLDPNGEDPPAEPAGFKLLRTGNNVNPITGVQDTVSPTQYIIHGFGQTASSFDAQYPGRFQFAPKIQNTAAGWGANLLIAEGTYTVGGALPAFSPVHVATIAGVFVNATGTTTQTALVLLVPEPATLTLFGLAMVGFAGMVRCVRGRDRKPHQQERENS